MKKNSKEHSKGFEWTGWMKPQVTSVPYSMYCLGHNAKTGEWTEWVEDSKGNKIECS